MIDRVLRIPSVTPSFALLQSLAKKTGDAYVVEKIIGQKKRHDGVTLYHVDWGERYGSDRYSWEPEANCVGAQDKIAEYLAQETAA